MAMIRLRSLQAQLAIRLAAVLLAASARGVGAIVYEGMNAADALGDEQLVQRAEDIARCVVVDASGKLLGTVIDRTRLPVGPYSSRNTGVAVVPRAAVPLPTR